MGRPGQTSRASIGIGESEITSGKSKWRSQKEVLDGKGGACAPQDIDILHLSFFRSAREENILESEALALVSCGDVTPRGFRTFPRGEQALHPLAANIPSTHFFASRWRDPHQAAFHKPNTLSIKFNTRWRPQALARSAQRPSDYWSLCQQEQATPQRSGLVGEVPFSGGKTYADQPSIPIPTGIDVFGMRRGCLWATGWNIPEMP